MSFTASEIALATGMARCPVSGTELEQNAVFDHPVDQSH